MAISGVKLMVKEDPQMKQISGKMQQPAKKVSVELEED